MEINISQEKGSVPVTVLELTGQLDGQTFKSLIASAQEALDAVLCLPCCSVLLAVPDAAWLSLWQAVSKTNDKNKICVNFMIVKVFLTTKPLMYISLAISILNKKPVKIQQKQPKMLVAWLNTPYI